MINQQQYEAQLQQIFRLLLENKTQEEIATELHISTRTVARYSQRIEKRYGEMQRQKTDDTIFLECQLFKNRMLTLYKGLEDVVTSKDRNISGSEKAKAAEVAANIAIDVIKAESEGLRFVTELISRNKYTTTTTNKGQRYLNNLNQSKNDESDNIEKEYNPNRKF
jgi:hypothetical protein